MHGVGGCRPAANHSVRAVGVLVGFPAVAGRPHHDLFVEADVFHLDRTDDQVLRLLDDHVLERHVVLLDLLAELEVRAGRLPEVHDPLFLRHGTDHALGDVGQELQTPHRWHVRGFLHDAHLGQLAALVVGEDHLLLAAAVTVWRGGTVQLDVGAFLFGAEVFWPDYET